MAAPSTGYAIENITTLRAIGASDRSDGYTRLLLNDGNGNSVWVTFDSAATTGDYRPNDEPSTGWWKITKGCGSFSNTATYSSLNNNASVNFERILGQYGIITSVELSYNSWLVAYISSTARTSDSSRTVDQDPAAGSGVLLEIKGTGLFQITPTVHYFNESLDGSNIYFKLTNLSGSTANITVKVDGVRCL